jgi:hypothetical protein
VPSFSAINALTAGWHLAVVVVINVLVGLGPLWQVSGSASGPALATGIHLVAT